MWVFQTEIYIKSANTCNCTNVTLHCVFSNEMKLLFRNCIKQRSFAFKISYRHVLHTRATVWNLYLYIFSRLKEYIGTNLKTNRICSDHCKKISTWLTSALRSFLQITTGGHGSWMQNTVCSTHVSLLSQPPLSSLQEGSQYGSFVGSCTLQTLPRGQSRPEHGSNKKAIQSYM